MKIFKDVKSREKRCWVFGRHAPQSDALLVPQSSVLTGAWRSPSTASVSANCVLKKGPACPITGSYVKEGTYRRGVVWVPSADDDPPLPPAELIEGGRQAKWCFETHPHFLAVTESSTQEPKELWELLVPFGLCHTFIRMQPSYAKRFFECLRCLFTRRKEKGRGCFEDLNQRQRR